MNSFPPNPRVEKVLQLTGEGTVLVPVPVREKRPTVAEWHKTPVSKMSDPMYLMSLEAGNIGVLVGSPSGGLVSIDIDDDADVEPFLDLNPALRQSLRTRGSRGANIWLFITGELPSMALLKTKDGISWGEFRSDGAQTIIDGTHPNGNAYQRVVDAPPMEIRFDEIRWPENLETPWEHRVHDEIVLLEGAPLIYSGRSVQLNPSFFAEQYRTENIILFEPDEEQFYRYDPQSGLYVAVTESVLKVDVSAMLKRDFDELGHPELTAKRDDACCRGLVAILRGKVEQREAFNRDGNLIHVANGVLRLTANQAELLSYHSDFRSRNRSPIAFDKNADCPRFRNELLGSALSEEDISLLQRWGGSVLLGENSAQAILILSGTSGAGKSTLINIIESIVGQKNVAQLRTEHLGERFETYSFVGKTLLTGKDVDPDFLKKKTIHHLKSLTGSDLLEAEKKGGNHKVQIRGKYNIVITCNADPQINLQGDIEAWRRRFLMVRYEGPKPARTIPNLDQILLNEEGPGILRFFIDGAIAHLSDLQSHRGFRLTDTQRARVGELLNESDSIKRFVEEGVDGETTADLTCEELFRAYEEYCERRGWTPQPKSAFSKPSGELILQIHKRNQRHDIQRGGGGGHKRGYNKLRVLAWE